ncbi:hypothetical protein C8R44DRAFT_744875 [Mycena epipterygia]|nr:hypothetical protein C8R44DRAFT_744875 [Mycena epipterygia]
MAILGSLDNHSNADPESLVHQGMAHFQHFNDPLLEARFYNLVGYYYQRHKIDHAASAQSLNKALSLAKLSGDLRQTSIALSQRAWLKYVTGHYLAGQMQSCEAQKVAQLSGDLFQEAMAQKIEGHCLLALGNLKYSSLSFQRQRVLLQLCGMQGGDADYTAMMNLAEIYLLKSDYLEARSIHIQLFQKASAHQNLYHTTVALLNIAEIDVMIGADVLEVQRNLDNVKRTFCSLALIRETNQCKAILADLHLREGNTITAKVLLQQCLDATWRYDSEIVSYCLERLADVGRWTSDKINWPYKWAVIYLVQAHKTHEKLALHKALRFIGDIFLSEGDEYTACNLFIVALEGFTYMDIYRGRADCMFRLGEIEKHRGDLVKAAELWKEARPLFEQSSQVKDIVEVDTRLALVSHKSNTVEY